MERSEGVSRHILPTSATMLGVCITVLSIGKLAPAGTLHWLFDKLLGLGSLAFLASAALSFVSIRSRIQWGDWKPSRVLLGGVTVVIVFAFA